MARSKKDKYSLIRSSKLSLKFTNPGKRDLIDLFTEEYWRVTALFVDPLWTLGEDAEIQRLFSKNFTDQVSTQTWLSARAVQAAAKQASGIVRGTREKQKRREFVYAKLLAEGKTKQAQKLKKVIDKTKMSKPDLKNMNPQLDSRFVKIDWESETSFDAYVNLTCLGTPPGWDHSLKIVFPIKLTKHFNEMKSRGEIRPGLRLNSNSVTCVFSIPKPEPVSQGTTVGVDIGYKKVFSSSDGVQSQEDVHGWTLPKIIAEMNHKKKGSKAFARAQAHRTNYINWSLNQLNLRGVKTLKIEAIKNLRLGVRTSKSMRSWTYTEIFGKLGRLCEDTGVQIIKVPPAFTSQRCSCCGWVQKANRKGEMFKCKKCGFAANADLNASRNISLNLTPLGEGWRSLDNRRGFYWAEIGQEHVVPDTQEMCSLDKSLCYP